MTALLRRPVTVGAVAFIVLVGLGGLATSQVPNGRHVAAAELAEVPVAETVVACPGLRSREGYTESTVAAATPPGADVPDADVPDAEGSGEVTTLTRDPARAKVLIALAAPGDRGAYVGRSGERDSVTGRATGALAPGFSVTQTERTVDGGGRGLASTSCLPTGAEFWFLGPASGVGQHAVLVLTNPESATAAVDVTFYGRSGELDAPGGRGVQVPQRSRVELRLDRLVPGEKVLALHVEVQVGRLSAAVTETDVDGLQPLGTDWIPGTSAPATRLVVPGVPKVVPDRDAAVRLDLVAPAGGAVVRIQLVAPDGTYAPLGADVVDVPEGTVRSVDLTEALRGDPAAVLVTADRPVAAGARVLLKRPDLYGDVLFLAAAQPLAAAAVVPDNRVSRDLTTRLVLSAPEAAATVQLLTFAGTVAGDPVTVEVPAGSTRSVVVEPPPGRRSFGLVVTPRPGSGPVYGVRILDEEGPRGPLVTALSLRTARLTVVVPEAVPNLAAGTTR